MGGRRSSGIVSTGRLSSRDRLEAFLGRGRGESLVVATARLVSAGCSLLVAVVSARHLGPSGRGEIVLVLTVAMLGSEFVGLGANVSGRIQILRRSGVAVEDYLGLTAVLAVVQAVLVGATLAIVGSLAVDLTLTTYLAGTGLGVAMFLAHMLVDASFALRRTLETGLRDLLIGVLPVVPVVALAATGRLSVDLVVGLTALGYAVGGVYLAMVVGRRTGRVRFSPPTWRIIVRNGLPVLGNSFGQTLAFRADRLVIGLVTTSATLGVFSVAATTAELPRLLLLPATQILVNRIAGGEIPVSSLGRLLVRLGVGYGLVMLAIGFVGGAVVLPVVGDGFTGVGEALPVLALGEALIGVHFLSIAVLTGLARFRRLPLPALLGSAILLVGDLLIVPEHGSIGASWMRVVGFGVMAGVSVTSMVTALRETP
ncbi:MAG: oligosaccharide flippase family protein [Actinomycetota bacterium]|nr:oligosaccharide flippase family protein [Actinomycetota bacterium]